VIIRPSDFDRGNIYLSGGMQYAKDLGAGWRIDCSQALKTQKYFPLDITELDLAYAKSHGGLFTLTDRSKHLEFKSDIRKHFIQTDLNLIQNMTDAIVIYYDESVRLGAGTISECQFAYNLNMPVFLVCDYPDMLKSVPGWLQGLTTKMFQNFEELYEYLDKLPYGIIRKDLYGNHRSGNEYLCSLCGDCFSKRKHLFVSQVVPLYCKTCVDTVAKTNDSHKNRYEYFMEYLKTGHADAPMLFDYHSTNHRR
jgi:hypothetical protein